MKTLLSTTLVALPLGLLLVAGAAAQSKSGGAGPGEGSGGWVAMNCLTGAYCPPDRGPVYIGETCDQVLVRERIPGTNRFRAAYRCQWNQ